MDKSKIAGIKDIMNILASHQSIYDNSIHLVPSENTLSPLAKIPFLLDAHARYFLDDLRLFGDWSFPGGKALGNIEQDILIPLLRKYAGARYVNVRALSGMNCMMIALAAITRPGDLIYTLPGDAGGHACTRGVAESLGLRVKFIPFVNEFDIDHDALAQALQADKPRMVYLDQATFLFPLNTQPVRDLIDRLKLDTRIHYDSSHLNGFILGGIVANPLERGAHSFGGSTHKTLPGPHKGFLATDDPDLAQAIQVKADHLVSQHHMASTISLAITMVEFDQCGGAALMRQVMSNTQAFCSAIPDDGPLTVHARERGYTGCHQVWMHPSQGDTRALYNCMIEAGIITNLFGGLPGLPRPAYRMSLAEFTRLGATEADAVELAGLLCRLAQDSPDVTRLREDVRRLRRNLTGPVYCFGPDEIGDELLKRVWSEFV